MTAAKSFWIPFGIVSLAYLGAFALLPGRGFFIADGGCKFIQAKALAQNDYRSLAIPWPGAALDPEGRFGPLPAPFGQRRHGKLYGFYSPTFVLVSAVADAGLGSRGLYVLPLLSGLALLPLTWCLADRLPAPRRGRPLALLLVGLATPIWFYSLAFWEHVPATALLVGAVVLWRRDDGSMRTGLVSGVCCGLAIHFRDELYLFAACMVAMQLGRTRWRSSGGFVLGLTVALAPLWAVQWRSFGTPWGAHLSGAQSLFTATYLRDRLDVVRVLLLQAHPSLWLSMAIGLPALALLLLRPACSPPRHRPMVRMLAGWGLVTGAIVLGGGLSASVPMQWLLHSNGLFAAAPVLIWGLVRRNDDGEADARARRLGRLILVYVVVYVLATPTANMAGVHWGCRLLLPLVPLLGAMAASTLAVWWESHPPRGDLALVALAILLSIGAQVFSLRLLDRRRSFDAEVNELVAARPEPAVATVGWNVPMAISGCFFQKQVFMVKTPQQLGSLLLFLQDAGEKDVLVVSAVSLRGLPLSDRRQLVDPTGFMLEMGSIDVTQIAPAPGGGS